MEDSTRLNMLIQDLRLAVSGLETVNPWIGLLRFGVLGGVFFSVVALAWLSSNLLLFLTLTAIAGVFYAFWLICTHDAVHYTLTGWTWFDRLMPRLISWPMLWPYGGYAHLHRLHHGWNGVDLRDPERIQWTIAEYQQAHPWMQWYVRHQWAVDLFVLGGFGLIAKTVINAFRFRRQTSSLTQVLWLDGFGILIMQTSFLLMVALHHRVWHYLLFWLVLERVIGVVMQTRDHLEHYGLWGTTKRHQLTQLYTSRTLKTNSSTAWLMGGLNNHAIHHAFPNIPFNQLPEAFCRVQAVLKQHDLPLMAQDAGYIQEALHLGVCPRLIGKPDPADLTGRYQMIVP